MGKIVKFKSRGNPTVPSFIERGDDSYHIYRTKEIFDLLFKEGNVTAVVELYDYCLDHNKVPEKRNMQLLINRGILDRDGKIPFLTSEAMYQIREGIRPPWLSKSRSMQSGSSFYPVISTEFVSSFFSSFFSSVFSTNTSGILILPWVDGTPPR